MEAAKSLTLRMGMTHSNWFMISVRLGYGAPADRRIIHEDGGGGEGISSDGKMNGWT
jgi:hypothetical protein